MVLSCFSHPEFQAEKLIMKELKVRNKVHDGEDMRKAVKERPTPTMPFSRSRGSGSPYPHGLRASRMYSGSSRTGLARQEKVVVDSLEAVHASFAQAYDVQTARDIPPQSSTSSCRRNQAGCQSSDVLQGPKGPWLGYVLCLFV